MKIIVLVENTTHSDLKAEHGLSLFIEFHKKYYLLDTGMTSVFLDNAQQLHVPIDKIQSCIISHGHYDHTGGLNAFLISHQKVQVYAMATLFEKHYSGSGGILHDISVPDCIEQIYLDRFHLIQNMREIDQHVYLLPHDTHGLDVIGKRSLMYIKKDSQYIYDDFSHELSLVFETEKGLVVLNSCSHAGIKNIVSEVKKAFPQKEILAFIGGLHLKGKKDNQEICTYTQEELFEMASFIKQENIAAVYTGHCTGKEGYQMLQYYLNDQLHSLYTGKVIEI